MKKELLEKKSPEQFYSKNKNKMMKQKVKPGVYTVMETDWAGERDIPQFNVKITKPMNYYEAAIQIANKTNYLSLWEYIVLKPTTGKAKITIPESFKEYRNMKKLNDLYDGELWIDNKFVQHITLSEVDYRYRILMIKLETLVDTETFAEIQEVIHLKYVEGSEMTRDLYKINKKGIK